MIEASRISKTYQGVELDRKESGIALWIKNASRLTSNLAASVPALRDVSFDVEQGEIFGIFGSNGAGKTTLIKILSGLLRPDQGSVRINGYSGIDQIKDQISYVSTNGWMGLEWPLTAYENLVLYGNIFGVPGRKLRALCDEAFERFGLSETRDKHISELSAGMRQKVTLARGFLLDRPILYLDEPTVSLDVQTSAQLREFLLDYACRERKTILTTSHNPVDLSICERIMFLHSGRAIALGTMDELLAPLQGIAAQHITCSRVGDAEALDGLRHELLGLDGVTDVRIGAANGKRQTWTVRVMLHPDQCSASEVVDVFIAQETPILGMETQSVTLQEIYEDYVEATDGG